MTVAYYRDLILSLLPPGAFDIEPGGIPYALATGLATVFDHADERVDQAAREVLPHTAEECLAEWEALSRAPARPGASTADRQAALVARWRLAIGLRLYAMRSILGPILEPEYQLRDPCNDGVVGYRYVQAPGNGAISEPPAGHLTPSATALADCRVGDQEPRVYFPLVDRKDSVIAQALITSWTANAGTGGGLRLEQSIDAFVEIGPQNPGGAALRFWSHLPGTTDTTINEIAIPAYPFWVQLSRTIEGHITASYGAALGALTTLGALTDAGLIPRQATLAAWNTLAALNLSEITVDEFRVQHGQQHNNVRIIETPLIYAIPAERKFCFFVHRDPLDSGAWSIPEAQTMVDRAKSGHTLGLVGESDNFLCDDPHSLTDRDILGV